MNQNIGECVGKYKLGFFALKNDKIIKNVFFLKLR